MKVKTVKFNSSSTTFYFAAGISHLKDIVDVNHSVIITDENVFQLHEKRFKGWKTIVIKCWRGI